MPGVDYSYDANDLFDHTQTRTIVMLDANGYLNQPCCFVDTVPRNATDGDGYAKAP